MAKLYEKAKEVRKTIMDQVLSEGTAPTVAEISRKHSLTAEEIDSIFKDLQAAVCIAVQDEFHAGQTTFQDEPVEQGMPPVGEIFYARPFSNFKNHYKIPVNGEQKWYGECAVECCGVSAMFPGKEVVVQSVCRQTKEPVELVGRDGDVLDVSPKTLRVHFGFPLGRIVDDMLGWCDFNSFFSSEDAVQEWRKTHPQIKGATRDPETVSHIVAIVGKGRLDYDYQLEIPLGTMLRKMKWLGMTRPLPLLGVHVPDPFFMFTPHIFTEWKRKGYNNFIRFSLR